MKYAVAIDIGGTNTRVALIDEELNIVSREQFSTDNKEPEITLNKISDIVKAFDKDITGIGMSCPGPLDLINGKVLTPPNLNGKWHNLEISKVLSEKTGKPVYLDNDANLAGLAEAVVGEGKRLDDDGALAVNHRCLVLPLGDVDPNDVHSVGSSHIQITDIPRAAEGHNLLRD